MIETSQAAIETRKSSTSHEQDWVKQVQEEFEFTDTFYGQLVINLDTLLQEDFEEAFVAPLREAEDPHSIPPQILYEGQSLRILFADVAAVYVEPVKVFILRAKDGEAIKDEIVIVKMALQDVARASSHLGLADLDKNIQDLINYLDTVYERSEKFVSTSDTEQIMLEYSKLVELLPQTFAFEGYERPKNVKVVPAPPGQKGARMTVSIAAAASNLVVYNYPPAIHKDVEVIERQERGVNIYWFKDQESNRYFKTQRREYEVIRLIDGTRTLNQICHEVKENFGLNLSPVKLAQIIAKLDSLGLIDGVKKAGTTEKKATGLFATKQYKVYNPDKAFEKMDRYLGWIFTKTFVLGSLAAMSLILFTLYQHYTEFYVHFRSINKSYGYLMHILPVLIVVSLHEIGHGLTCKHYGGRVTDTGFMMFNMIIPAGYCNVSDVYLFSNKLHKVYVLLAGLYTQYLIATIAAAGWLISAPHSLIGDLCCFFFVGATASTVINLIPFMKLDGYYTLTNLLGEHNLQQISISYVKEVASHLFYGEPIKRKDLRFWQKALYFLFGGTSLVFMSVFPLLLYVTYLGMLSSGASLGLNAIITIFFGIKFYKPLLTIVIAPFYGLLTLLKVVFSKAFPKDARVRSSFAVSLVLIGLVSVLFGHWNKKIKAECMISLPSAAAVPITSTQEGVVSELYVKDQQMIKSGQLIATIKSYQSDITLTRLVDEIAELQQKQQVLEREIGLRKIEFEKAKELAKNYRESADELVKEREMIHENLPPDLEVAHQQVEKSQSTVEVRKSRLERAEKLFASQLVPQTIYDNALLEYKKALEELKEAESRLEKATIEHRRTTNRWVNRADVAAHQAEEMGKKLEKAKLSLQELQKSIEAKEQEYKVALEQGEQLKLFAAKDGIVVPAAYNPPNNHSITAANTAETTVDVKAKDIKPIDKNRKAKEERRPQFEQIYGQFVTPSLQIGRILDLSQIRAEVDISEWELPNISVGQSVHLVLVSLNQKVFNAKVERISTQSNKKQGGERFYTVYLSIDGKKDDLRPGMSGIAVIDVGRHSVRELLWNWFKRHSDYLAWSPNFTWR